MNFKNNFHKIVMLLFMVTAAISCSDNGNGEDPKLTVSTKEATFDPEGGTISFTIDANSKWTIENSAAWLQIDKATGDTGNTTVTLTTLSNESGVVRPVKIRVIADNGQARVIYVTQTPSLYPSYNLSPKAPDATGMSNTAVPLVAKLGLGINIGNTFEAPGGETGWGSPVITEAFIKFLKAKGFNSIRIPCQWDYSHMADKDKARIDPAWLNRIKEVVGWCVNNDMYVFINIHWDGGWQDSNCTLAKKDATNAKVKAVWQQIATTMRDFDEHLMFASANEPVTKTAEEMGVLISYHQTFIKAVRSTGGHNTYRCLILQGDSSLIGPDNFPTDPTPNRLIFEEHNYTPFQFTLMDGDATWGKMFYYWGEGNHSTIEPSRNADWGEESEQIKGFDHLKSKFVDKGIPVLMGEYGAYRRGGSTNVPLDLEKHNASVDYWITYTTKTAMQRGIKPFFWDTGGLIDRQNLIVKDQRSLDAIIAGKI